MKSLIAAILIGGLTLWVLLSISSGGQLLSFWLMLSGLLATFIYRRLSNFEAARAEKKALSRFERAIKLNPSGSAAYFERGKYHLKRREFGKAIDDFTEAIRLGDTELEYKFYLERGWAFQSSSRYDEAIADYTQSVELNPGCEDAYLERGCIYAEQKKDYDAAIEDFNRVIELNPHNPDAKHYLVTFESERSAANNESAGHQLPATKDAWRSPILTGNYVSPVPWYKRGNSGTSYDGEFLYDSDYSYDSGSSDSSSDNDY